METSVPAVEDANVWGLVRLKKGNRRKQVKLLTDLHNETKPFEASNELTDEMNSRRVAFKGVKKQMALWKGPVYKNRLADQLIFPVTDKAVVFSNSDQALQSKLEEHITTAKENTSSLQGKLYSILYGSQKKHHIKEDKFAQINEQMAKQLMEKIAAQRKERFLMDKMAAKNKRQNKIKSKRFHRHLKSRLMKEYEKETEEMRTNDPRAFAHRIVSAELARVKERASLRHRSGSKFARLQKIRANYDSEARQAVAEMHSKSKELTRRNELESSSDSSDSDIDVSSESEANSETDLDVSDAADEGDDASKRLLWWQRGSEDVAKPPTSEKPPILSTLAADTVLSQFETTDPSLFPKTGTIEEHDPEAELLDPASETFFRALEETCKDDVELGKRFETKKMEVVEEETLKPLDTFMPGWNCWTGPGTEESDEKKRKMHLIPGPNVKRKDEGRSHVIIRRKMNSEFKQHLVKSIPFPHNTPEQFEAHISQPISREWTSESIHYELTRPKVTVQTGRIIRPISKSSALLRDKDTKRLVKQTRNV